MIGPVLVAVVGSSAGGLEALREFFRAIPANAPLSIVVAQHLSPSHESLLTSLLAKETDRIVREAHGVEDLVAGEVLIVPPGHHAHIHEGNLVVNEATQEVTPKPNINLLLESAAKELEERCVGVLLSGTGTDGTMGLLALRNKGGTTFVQQPEEAAYDGMPRAAIRMGAADYVLPVGEIGRRLGALALRHMEESDEATPHEVSKLVDMLARARGIDLHQYKPTTIRRRLARRIRLGGCSSVEEYCDLLARDNGELDALVGDLFINVTSFFRDSEYFEELVEILEEKVRQKAGAGVFRIWSAGCASGEEAYSIAMAMHQIGAKLDLDVKYQVFASDIDPEAVAVARRARYSSDSLAHLSPEFRSEYFVAEDHGYWRVKSVIREHVLFTSHDLAKDPPFSQLDLVLCRNVLIYMGNALQEQVISTFAFSLVPEGLLFLGRSESANQFGHLFNAVSNKAKIYARRTSISRVLPRSELMQPARPAKYATQDVRNRDGVALREDSVYRQIALAATPPALLINDQDQLVFTSNGAIKYTQVRDGLFSVDVHEVVVPELRPSLRAVLFRTRRTGRSINVPVTIMADEDHSETLVMHSMPFADGRPNWVLITLTPAIKEPKQESEGDEPVLQVLEMELAATRNNLQTLVEELETTNEELQTMNEELQSTSEEAQATNEQLQTSNEELQSSNEELRTLNDELQAKNYELERLYSELVSLDGSLRVPFLVLDHDLRIQRVGRYASYVMVAEATRLGDPVSAVVWRGNFPFDLETIREGVANLTPWLWITEGNTWRVEVSEHQTGPGFSKGVLISFHDVTQVVQERNRAESTERAMAQTIGSLQEAVIRINSRGIVEFANDAAAHLLEVPAEELRGRAYGRVLRLSKAADREEPTADFVRSVLEHSRPVRSEGLLWLDGGSVRRMVEITATPVGSPEGDQSDGAVVIIRDVTERENLLSELSWRGSHDKLTGLENRIAYDRALEDSRQRAILTGKNAWLLLLDLDRFKPINDVGGHATGDEVLREVAQVMRKVVRSSDRLFRIGGDEFALIIEEAELHEVEKVAKKLVSEVKAYRPFSPVESLRLGISAGISALHLSPDRSEGDITRDADLALYRVKSKGGSGFAFARSANPEDGELASVYGCLSRALERSELVLVAQPIVCLRGGPGMYEVLTRLPGPRGELIMPGEFIPLAERYALMSDLDEQVITRTLQFCESLELAGREVPIMTVNLSGRSIGDPRFVERLRPLAEKHGKRFQKLIFEVTETAAIQDLGQASKSIRHLVELGARTALDDFGAGNSTFIVLKSLGVDFVKIDRQFVREIRPGSYEFTCAEALCRVAHAAKKTIIAEGIETEGVLPMLTDLGVEFGQGWHFGRPDLLDNIIAAV